MAAHPVESFNTLRRRGIATRIAAGDLESAMGGGEGDEVGGEPTYGNGEPFFLGIFPCDNNT